METVFRVQYRIIFHYKYVLGRFGGPFLCRTDEKWTSRPALVFPSFDMGSFKRGLKRHQVGWIVDKAVIVSDSVTALGAFEFGINFHLTSDGCHLSV